MIGEIWTLTDFKIPIIILEEHDNTITVCSISLLSKMKTEYDSLIPYNENSLKCDLLINRWNVHILSKNILSKLITTINIKKFKPIDNIILTKYQEEKWEKLKKISILP